MSKVLFLSPSARELSAILPLADKLGCELIFDSFDEHYLDNFLGQNPDLSKPNLDINVLLESTLLKYSDKKIDGVTSAIGYPGMSAVSIIAQELGLPGPTPKAIMLCEHKYYSRVSQKQFTPEATPKFNLIDPHEQFVQVSEVQSFPAFLKPVKSCMSKNAHRVADKQQLANLIQNTLLPAQFIAPFNDMIKKYTDLKLSADYLLLEELVEGTQVSLEGFVFQQKIIVMGVIDAVMFPGTLAFKRWQYPSQLSEDILDRMTDVATRFFKGIKYDNALFNMELFYDSKADRISIIEINPKIASQFPGLFEKVDGYSSYQTLLEVALQKNPTTKHRDGKYAVAASCVLRVFEDHHVKSIPTEEQIQAVEDCFPDTKVQIYAKKDQKLSDLVQDSVSFRYGLIEIGADDEDQLEEKFELCKQMLTFDFSPVRV